MKDAAKLYNSKNPPQVSVIIPVYNVKNYLNRCLDSALAQTYSNLDIVIIDDGSTDGSAAIIDEYASKDARIQAIHQKNAGVSQARNAGIDAAKGEWIAFLDSDDEMTKDAVETLLLTALEADAPMSMGGYYRCHHKTKLSSAQQVHIPEGIFEQEALLKFYLREGKNHNYLWTRLFRADLFDNQCFPIGKLYEDIYILPRLLKKAGRCVMTDHPIYYYHIRKSGITGNFQIEKQIQGLQACLAAKQYICELYPNLAVYASSYIMELCCWLLGKIDKAGRKESERYWNQVTKAFLTEKNSGYEPSLFLTLAALIFQISPVLLGKLCRFYSFLNS